MTKSTNVELPRAKALMQEALDTIQATYWIQNKEFTFAEGTRVDMIADPASGEWVPSTYDWSDWEKCNKFILAEIDDDYELERPYANNSQAKVTGVCSIGALTLAEVTLYDMPLLPFESRSEWDLGLYLAGAALAMAIWNNDHKLYERAGDHAGCIANWNDASGRTRGEVVDMFTKALESPLLTMEEGTVPYTITMHGVCGLNRSNLVFATEQEADAFLHSDEVVTMLDARFGGDQRYEVTPLHHMSMSGVS